jgi:hypothetical protein
VEKSLLVLMAVFAFTLILAALMAAQRDESLSHKLAKVRVRVDDSRRRQAAEPQEEEFDPGEMLPWFVFGAFLLLILMLAGAK